MFNLFVHKRLYEPSPFELTETVKDYITIAQPKIIIISPGYLSNTSNTTNLLLRDIFFNWTSKNGDRYVGITAGMNGVDSIGNPTNLNNHWLTLNANNINIIYFRKSRGSSMSYRTNRDHKKMIFFADFITPGKSSEQSYVLDKSNLDNFINNIKVKAVATGSSNFSKTTYLGSSRGDADKGESDIFMYSGESDGNNALFHDYLMETLDSNEEYSTSSDSNEEYRTSLDSNEEKNNRQNLTRESSFVPKILSQSLKIGSIPPQAASILSGNLSSDERYLTWMLYQTLKDQLS